MCRMQIPLVFVALYVGMVQSWDIALSAGDDTLSFYTNEILTSTTSIKSRKITVLAYDEVHNMMLYVDSQTNNNIVCGYDITSAENKCFTQGSGRNIHGLAFDPVTERVFFTDTNDRSVNWISLQPGFKNDNGHLLVKMAVGIPRDIVVDSCKGFVYWLNTNLARPTIERLRVDGTEREVFKTLTSIPLNARTLEPNSLAIDQQSHTIYWMEPENTTLYKLCTSALNMNQKIPVINYGPIPSNPKFTHPLNTLTVSKNSVIFRSFANDPEFVKTFSNSFSNIERKPEYEEKRPVYIVANYKIKDQIQGIQDCEALSQVEVASECDKPFCVHGTKLNEQSSFCKCTPGYTGERCDVSICEKYCLQGDCSFNDEGHPECRCSPGYSGERCQVSVCDSYCFQGNCNLNDKGLPECSCNAGYSGERCQVSVCERYCFQGNCSFNDEGLPECRCEAGYSGQRCEVNECRGYCLNDGECSLNEEDEPSCQCVEGYEGTRCEADRSDSLTCSCQRSNQPFKSMKS